MKFARLRRVLHRLFFAATAFATLAALFYTEENWRGTRAWAAVKRELQARGETLDRRDLVPPPIPDGQNLAMAPLFTRLFAYRPSPRNHVLTFDTSGESSKSDTYKLFADMPFGPVKQGVARPVFRTWTTGHALDLAAAQRFYQLQPGFPHADQPQSPAEDVLLALTRYGPLLDELARASAERPLTRFPVNWTLRPAYGISLPHYNYIQLLTATLRLRAVAELAAGQTPAARRDLAQIFRLRRAIEREPCLIAALVDATCIGLLLQPVWEGLASRQWSADDLAALGESLQEINILREYQLGMRGEQVFAACWPEDLQVASQAREMARVLPLMQGNDTESAWSTTQKRLWYALPWWPRGWYEQNSALASRYLQTLWIDTVDTTGHRLALARIKDTERMLRDIPLKPTTVLAKIALPVFTTVSSKFAQNQTKVDQAVTACALERYYLDRHSYPATLAALTPGYLDRVPTDVIDGAPMRYRLTVDGRYQLYSIGWDEQDEGGVIDWPADRKWRQSGTNSPAGKEPSFPNPVSDKGDWVWQYAPAEPPDPPNNQSRLESLP